MPEMTSVTADPKPHVPEFLRKPVTVLQSRVDAMEVEARRGLGGLLQSSDAGLHELDRFLERMAREDWTVPGMRRRIHSLRSRAENARASAIRRMEELPGTAVSAIATASRARVRELSRGLQAVAKRIEPAAPAPAAPAAPETAPRRVNGV